MINDVVLATLNEFCQSKHNKHTITIQQDEVPTHINPRDHERMQCLTDMGLEDEIKFVTQPANSPDLNVNNLGFFNALQSMCCCTIPTNEVELIKMVTKTFNEHPAKKINRIWLSLQTVFNNAIEGYGGNKCKMTRMGKETLEQEGGLPALLEVTPMARFFLEDSHED